MVCHQKPHTERLDQLCLPDCSDAIVHSNNEFHASVLHLLNGVWVQSVALLTFRDAVCNICSHFEEIGVQHDGGGHTIAVIVAIDADAGSICNGLVQAVHSVLHVCHSKRIFQLLTLKKIRCALHVPNTACRQYLCAEVGQVAALRNFFRNVFIRLMNVPLFHIVLHFKSRIRFAYPLYYT